MILILTHNSFYEHFDVNNWVYGKSSNSYDIWTPFKTRVKCYTCMEHRHFQSRPNANRLVICESPDVSQVEYICAFEANFLINHPRIWNGNDILSTNRFVAATHGQKLTSHSNVKRITAFLHKHSRGIFWFRKFPCMVLKTCQSNTPQFEQR